MEVRSYDLSAGVNHRFDRAAKFFMLIETGGPVTVRFLKNRSRTREVATAVEAGYISKPGDWRDPEDRFDGFELQSTSSQTVRVGISDREGDYRRALSLVQVDQPNTLTTTADATAGAAAAEIVAANSNRRKLILQNVSVNDARVGDSNVAAARGILLAAGASITLDTTAAVYAIRTGGTDATIAILEEEKA